jgi:hypothetical protein
LTPGAYSYYKNNVKGNQYIDYDTARRKLTRNVILSQSLGFDGFNREILMYGCLKIAVKDDSIVWIENYKGEDFPFNVDEKKYNKLNRKLGIN